MALVEDAGVSTDLVIQLGQDVGINGDPGRDVALSWGSGGVTLSAGAASLKLRDLVFYSRIMIQGGALVVTNVQFERPMSIRVTGVDAPFVDVQTVRLGTTASMSLVGCSFEAGGNGQWRLGHLLSVNPGSGAVEMSIDGCTFTNLAGGAGAAISLDGETNVIISRSSFLDNFATGAGGQGGAISSQTTGLLWIEQTQFLRNRADNGNGGALNIYSLPGSRLHIETTTFSGNVAADTLDGDYMYQNGCCAGCGGDAVRFDLGEGQSEFWSDAEVMIDQPLDTSLLSGGGSANPPPIPPPRGCGGGGGH